MRTLPMSASSAPKSSRRIARRPIAVPRRRNRSSSGAASCRSRRYSGSRCRRRTSFTARARMPVSTSPPAEVASRKTPTTRVPNSSGPLPGQRHDAHPAHRVAGEHHRPGRGDGVEHLAEVAAGAVDGGVDQRRPARPAVAALVPQHQPGPVAQGGALDLPLHQAGGEPVREDDGERRVLVAVELDVQRYAVVGGDGAGARRRGTGRSGQGDRGLGRSGLRARKGEPHVTYNEESGRERVGSVTSAASAGCPRPVTLRSVSPGDRSVARTLPESAILRASDSQAAPTVRSRVRPPPRGPRRARRPLRPRARGELGRRRPGLRRPGRAGAARAVRRRPDVGRRRRGDRDRRPAPGHPPPAAADAGARGARGRSEGPPGAPADPRRGRAVRRAHQRRPGARARGQRRARRRPRAARRRSAGAVRRRPAGRAWAGSASWPRR